MTLQFESIESRKSGAHAIVLQPSAPGVPWTLFATVGGVHYTRTYLDRETALAARSVVLAGGAL